VTSSLLGALVLGHGFGAFGDGVFGQLSGEDETHGGLYLPGGHGLSLVVLDELAGLGGDSVEGIADKGVEDRHRSFGDSSVRMDLLEDAVDVDVVGLSSFAPVLPSGGSSSGHVW
jgi:hypothetical protein